MSGLKSFISMNSKNTLNNNFSERKDKDNLKLKKLPDEYSNFIFKIKFKHFLLQEI